MDDYSGPFDPHFELEKLSRGALARLGREYMLFGHFIDRGLMPQVGQRLGMKGMEETAIAEWMGASPVYTRRIRRSMGIEGDDVATIMKSLQLDVGFPHQYMDVHYEVENERLGFFWLQSCGALLDVEPYGEHIVLSTCHHIEDPTFDATAVATNPRARCRPVHRPPRQPSDRIPHCRWALSIDPQAEPLTEGDLTKRVGASRLARIELTRPADAEPGGRPDYSGTFDPTFQLEDLSQGGLVLALKEFVVASHLIVRAAMTYLGERSGNDAAREIASAQWIGLAPVVSQRLKKEMRIDGNDAAAMLKVLQLHPSFPREYTRLGFRLLDKSRGHFWIDDCEALHEEEPSGWLSLLGSAPHSALDALVQAVNPRARCRPITPYGEARLAWEVSVDETAEPAPEPPETKLVRLSTVSAFEFTNRRG